MGKFNKYLGVKVTKTKDGNIKLVQPHLIAQILEDLHLHDNTHSKPTPTKSTPTKSSTILKQDLDQEPMHGDFDYRSIIGKLYFLEKSTRLDIALADYRSVIGKLNFLEKSTRPDIAFAVHQCVCFSSNPRVTHTQSV